MAEEDYVEHKSNLKFLETVEQLIETIEKVGMDIFAKLDHAAAAQDLGVDIPPSVVLIYGHARTCSPVIRAVPIAALDLPLRVLIRQNDRGETMIAFHPVTPTMARHAISGQMVDRLAKAQQLLVCAVKSEEDGDAR